MTKNIKRLVVTALGAAIICIFTAFFQFQIPGGTGYIHPGDSFIYIFACTLPFPYNFLAGAIGASLADVISGYAIYAIPTFIIKSLMAIPFTNKGKNLSARNIAALAWGTVALVGGYYLAEIIIYGNATALVNAFYTAIQGGVNAVLFIIYSVILSKAKAYNSFKEELK